jgi:hypothetical protein
MASPVSKKWLMYLLANPFRIGYFWQWRRSLREGRNALSDGVPWMTYEAVRWLSTHVNGSTRVFEWGSGGSTLFFARHAGSVVSVEHDRGWHSDVSKALGSINGGNVTRLLCEPEATTAPHPSYLSTSQRHAGMSFQRYVETIDSFADGHFDLVLVDGRARTACMRQGIPKLRLGGYLMLDDAERDEYREGIHLVDGWARRTFVGPKPYGPYFAETSIWRKP